MPTRARAHALVLTHNRALRTQNPRYWVDAWPGKSASGGAALRNGHSHTDEILMDRHECNQARPAAATFA